MYDTIWNVSLLFIGFAALVIFIFLSVLPMYVYSKLFRKRKTYHSLLLILYPITLTIIGKYLEKKSKLLYHQDLNIRMANDLSTHILSLDKGLNHLIIGYFLQISAYLIYIIVILIFIVKIIESRNSFSNI